MEEFSMHATTNEWTAKAGGEVFAPGAEWWGNACLNYSGESGAVCNYIVGYKMAGDVLVQRVLQDRQTRDVLVFPIVFLYRHYLELQLKELIGLAQAFLDLESALPSHHQLQQLWPCCSKLLLQVWPEKPIAHYKKVKDCVDQFVRVDRNGVAFRYTREKDGTRTLAGLRHVSIPELARTVQQAADVLDGCDTFLSVQLEWKADMNAEFGP
ncbi:MAG: hypothetical protein IID43_01405 [Planctomycetes bacterium]|nr:hypothetical protein [Planctomycetota bacterium]